MAFAGSPVLLPVPASSSTSASPQQKRHQEQCSAKILQALLGIVAQPQGETQSDEPESEATLQQQSHMELSQIELIYRAEGNANLVVALPQFKKVLRLPKTSTLLTTSHSNSNSNSSKYNKMKIVNTQQQTDANAVKGRQVHDKEWQQHQQHQQQQQQQTQEVQLQHQHQPEQQKHQEVVQSASDPAVNQNAKG